MQITEFKFSVQKPYNLHLNMLRTLALNALALALYMLRALALNALALALYLIALCIFALEKKNS